MREEFREKNPQVLAITVLAGVVMGTVPKAESAEPGAGPPLVPIMMLRLILRRSPRSHSR